MHRIVSRRHKVRFYATIVLAILFYGALGTGMITFYKRVKNPVTPALSVFVYAFAGYTVYRYYKNAPVIKLDGNQISFNAKTFSLSDLQNLQLTGKQHFPYITSFPKEAAALYFNDGQRF